jgi:hypothetical protein
MPNLFAPLPRAFVYAVVLGSVGFAGGFFGPMIVDPTSGNGPLLGIFLTGPGGMVLGFAVGLVADLRARRR